MRVIASLKLSWDIAKGLKFDVRGNIDYNDKLHGLQICSWWKLCER